MTTLEINILADTDESFVMSILNAMAERRLIRVRTPNESMIRPGPALSVDVLNQFIDKSEQSGHVSVEEAKARLGI